MPPRPPARTESTRQPLRKAAARGASGPWQFGLTPVIGLVGGIGSGKSTVAAHLATKAAHILDADTIGHALLDQKPTRLAITRRFGSEVLDPAQPDCIDRATLAQIVFADPLALRDLERIIHPRMRLTFEKAIARTLRNRSAKAVVLDAAVLFEAGWDDLCDVVWFVDAPRSARIQRVAQTRNWTPDTLTARERAQQPLEQKKKASTDVIRNDGSLEQLISHIDTLWSRLQATTRQHRQALYTRRNRPAPTPDAEPESRPAKSYNPRRSASSEQAPPTAPRAKSRRRGSNS